MISFDKLKSLCVIVSERFMAARHLHWKTIFLYDRMESIYLFFSMNKETWALYTFYFFNIFESFSDQICSPISSNIFNGIPN
jgi:hypothetical protein